MIYINGLYQSPVYDIMSNKHHFELLFLNTCTVNSVQMAGLDRMLVYTDSAR